MGVRQQQKNEAYTPATPDANDARGIAQPSCTRSRLTRSRTAFSGRVAAAYSHPRRPSSLQPNPAAKAATLRHPEALLQPLKDTKCQYSAVLPAVQRAGQVAAAGAKGQLAARKTRVNFTRSAFLLFALPSQPSARMRSGATCACGRPPVLVLAVCCLFLVPVTSHWHENWLEGSLYGYKWYDQDWVSTVRDFYCDESCEFRLASASTIDREV